MILPLRDTLMYRAKEMAAELPARSIWDKNTRVFWDCGIKTTPDYRKDGDTGPWVYSYDSMQGLVVDAGKVDTHHSILQFIEEGSMELACLMVSFNIKQPECSDMAKRSGVEMTTRSTCWHEAYKAMWGEDPAIPAGGSSSSSSARLLPASRGFWGLAWCLVAPLLLAVGFRRSSH
mmetsp:Transcript_33829/g.85541  ORF Transcript_33829/g.85541 Transcript_33829/m.85541 type:complete len:176 (+) Transcript_33829:543-1070(+)